LSLVLAVQVVLFFLLFKRPVWALASLIVGQFTASSFMFSISPTTMISARFVWTVLAIVLLVPLLRSKGQMELGSKARRILIPAIIFFCLAIVANAVNTDLSYTFQYFRLALTNLVILILVPAFVKNEKDIKLLALVALITCTVSAVVAVMQHYTFKGLPAYSLTQYTLWPGRSSGLTESPVHLSYFLPIILLPITAIYFLGGIRRRARLLLILVALVMAAALFFTYTRAGLYSLAPGLLAIIILMKGKAKKELFLVALILFAAVMYYSDWRGNRYSKGFAEDESAAGRLVLWEAGVRIALDYPLFGIGEDRFQEVSPTYSSDINPSTMQTLGAGSVLGIEAPHNDFLRVWLSFGTPALIAFLWAFVGIFHNFLDSYRQSSRRFLKSLALGCFAAMIAYTVNAATHNLMDSVSLLWILGGLSIATARLASSKQTLKVSQIR
jgi:O-antigen ligase